MKVTTLKKAILVMGLGLGLATGANAKDPDNWPNCYELFQKCAAGNDFACVRYDRYC